MKLINTRAILFAVALAVAAFSSVNAQGVARSECFPFEKLSVEQRKSAEELLLKALDESALYTIVGGLKPMSSGFRSMQMQVSIPRVSVSEAEKIVAEFGSKKPEDLSSEEKARFGQAKNAVERSNVLAAIADTRSILAQWKCGDDLYADVQHFTRAYDGKRFLDAFVVSQPRLREMLKEKADYFSRWGITPNSHPLEVIYSIDADETGAREGAYGYLFGYPDHAVKFFVQSGDEEKFTGNFVARDFISIPTFSRETNGFVYAVPKGYAATDIDKDLRAKAEPILAAYKKRRAEYIGEGKKGVVELLRDWFCVPDGRCSASNAKFD